MLKYVVSSYVCVIISCKESKQSWNNRATTVIAVSDCGELTEDRATYVLQRDITIISPSGTYCFQISSPSITLDGNGSSIVQALSDEVDSGYGTVKYYLFIVPLSSYSVSFVLLINFQLVSLLVELTTVL